LATSQEPREPVFFTTRAKTFPPTSEIATDDGFDKNNINSIFFIFIILCFIN